MKYSAEILLTVLMGSLLCFQLALAQCDVSTCEGKEACCCSFTKSCYLYLNRTVTNYFEAVALCNTLDRPSEGIDVSLPAPIEDDIPLYMSCCGYSISYLPTYFFAQGQGLLDCPRARITAYGDYIESHCFPNEISIVICMVANCAC
ncbi:UNVERIFIED_CONTAM: hypothetical protein RMT77_018455 [Armadillidium vulgare]